MYIYIYILTQNKGCESFGSQMKWEKWQNQYSKINSGCEILKFAKNVDETDLQGGNSIYTYVDMKIRGKSVVHRFFNFIYMYSATDNKNSYKC